jgi:uncharacterized protein YbjQ (UPF0145 family)
MKTKEIAKRYGIDQNRFEIYLRSINAGHESSFSFTLDGDIDAYVKDYNVYLQKELKREAAFEQEMEQRARSRIEAEEAKKKAEEEAEKEKILKEQEKLAQAQEEENKMLRALAGILITSGFTFDGYRIRKYSGLISADTCAFLKKESFFSLEQVDSMLSNYLVKERRDVIRKLKQSAYDLGCNAVIGARFDYIVIQPHNYSSHDGHGHLSESYVLCVTITGNAVIIEKE